MINLLLLEEKKKIHRDYAFRLFSVVLNAISVSALIGIVTLFPSYFISDLEKRAAVDQAELVRETNDDGEENVALVLKEAQQKLEILSPEYEKVSIRTIFDTTIGYKPSTVALTGIIYQKDDKGNIKITISGVADRRDDLLMFSQGLKKDALFDDVELPVSNLAKDRNIKFTLTVIGMF